MKKPKMLDAIIAVTYQCNSRCRMCNIWKIQTKPTIQPEDYRKLPNTLTDVNISGGEPFLVPNLDEVIRNVRLACPKARIIISTNGLAPDLIASKIPKILEIDPHIGVCVSLDGIGKVHEEVRNIPMAYEKVLETVQKLKALKVKNIKFAYTALDCNIGEINKVYDLANQLGIGFTFCGSAHNSESHFQTQENKIEKYSEFTKHLTEHMGIMLKTWSPTKWARAYFAYGLLKFIKTNKRIMPSYEGMNYFYLDPNGNFYSSNLSTDSMGNIKDINTIYDLDYSKISKDQTHWLLCTARVAIRKHKIRVLLWSLYHKFLHTYGVSK